MTPSMMASCLTHWKIETLTEVQRLAVDADVPTGVSAIVCAPTSSGKTLIGELAIAHALSGGYDAIYLVSHKALAEQKFTDFQNRFTSILSPAVSVGISTGDHDEGEVNCRLLVSTYEKALALLLSGRLRVRNSVIVADELQLLGEEGRGGQVETLCALLKQRSPHQFIGLTATVNNPEDLAHWLGCQCIQSLSRDVPLIQTISYRGQSVSVRFGDDVGDESGASIWPTDLHGLIRKLIHDGLGPVLVFTETRREASDLAREYSVHCQRGAAGLAISEQLALFSEPTDSSTELMSHAERRVTFHTADLTPDERAVIESGITNEAFDVCFATSTLAAGVNFPFRTVVFSKLTYGFGDRAGHPFSRADFRNMSGRAGRLGFHDDGRAFLLPRNDIELQHAKALVGPTNERVVSQLVNVSMRRTALALVAAHAVSSTGELESFFKNTFYWHQVEENNPKLLDTILTKAAAALLWLIEHAFIEDTGGGLRVTPFGRQTSASGLLPDTARQFAEMLRKHSHQLQDGFDDYIVGLIHWTATCPEFGLDEPSRFLPFPSGQSKPDSTLFMSRARFVTPWDRTDERTTRCVHAIGLFIQGEQERKVRFATGLSAGSMHRFAIDLAWVMDGLRRISGSPELNFPQSLTNQLGMLARRVRWGVPAEILDILRVAKRHAVPGFGRQRAMALLANGLVTVTDVVTSESARLARLVNGESRAAALVDALTGVFKADGVDFERHHVRIGRELGIEKEIAECADSIGTDYERAIAALLRQETSWVVTELDDGVRQNVPDLLLELGTISVLIECKTVTKRPSLLAKEEAFAVLQKAADYLPTMARVTLGKPEFDEHSKKKAAGSTAVTLVRHSAFMEGVLRVLTGRVTSMEFVQWLASPGVSELSRLPGIPTYAATAPAE